MKVAAGIMFALTHLPCSVEKIDGCTYYIHKGSNPDCMAYTMIDATNQEFKGSCTFAELLLAKELNVQINELQEILNTEHIYEPM